MLFNESSSLQHIQPGFTDWGSFAQYVRIKHADLIAKEIELIGSHGMPLADYDIIFDLISSKKIDLSLLIERTVKLEDVHQEMLTGTALKRIFNCKQG